MPAIPKNAAWLGIDLGGSNINSVIFDRAFVPIAEDKIDTEAKEGYEHVIARLKDQIDRLEDAAKRRGLRLTGIGLGVPGVVSPDSGLVRVAPNLGWENRRPLRDLGFVARPDVTSVLVNDVNAGLIGELTRIRDMPRMAVAYFCGTGIGGAVALNGRLWVGFEGGAGEVGHVIVRVGGRRCACGRRGCLEAYIGKWALNRRILRALDSGRKTVLKDIIDYNLKKLPVKSSSLKKALEKDDPFTVDLMKNHYSRFVAAGISQSANLLQPDLVILGGGMMESMGVRLLPEIVGRLSRYAIATPPAVRLAELGDLAGPTGAAKVALDVAGGNP
ncbi:MAG: ROK family protein [Spirochaetia bacterium]|nr:ROK family protein [Spirochaetia bacterium]